MEIESAEECREHPSAPRGGRSRVRLIFIVVVLLMTAASGIFAASSWYEAERHLLRELEHAASLMRQTVRAVLTHQESTLRVLGRRLEDVGALKEPERGRRLVEQMVALNETMAGFGLVRPDGQLLLVSTVPSGRPLPNLLEAAESRATFQEALRSDGMVVGRTYYFPLLERWLIPARIALRDSAGEVTLVMTAGIDIDAADALWNAIRVKPGMTLTLMRDDGHVQLVLPPVAGEREAVYAPTAPAPAGVAEGMEPLEVRSDLQRYPLTVVARYDRAAVLREYGRRMAVPLMLFLGTVLAGLVVFRFVQRSQQRYEDDLVHQATHDALTELPNRPLLHDRIHQDIAHARRNGRRVAVMYVDLDQFKRVNDSLGHKVGDLLLKASAGRLKACLREGDTVGRLGGDEFLLLFPDLGSLDDAGLLATRVLEAFHQGFRFDGRELFNTVSIGVAVFPDDGATADVLLQNADTALYRAKDQGRNAVAFFEQEYNRVAARRVAVESALRIALERDELTLVYQPKCDATTRSWEGAEALLRWRSPLLGTVSPAEFIPVAEDSGQIDALGRFVLRRALKDLVRIQRVAPRFTMAVNVSVRQFNDPGLVDGVIRLLDEMGIAPDLLELEVTESIMAARVPQLDALRDAGLRLAIDDFGTGFSSLSYLKRLPVTTLKLDREFVRDLEADTADKALVTAMIAVAHQLDLETVAEGVETEGQAEFLRRQGCTRLQGFLLAGPMDLEELMARLPGHLAATPPAERERA